MNADVIERLLMDRALGSLSPDCEALLAEHLQNRPDVEAQQAAIQETVSLARHAMAAPMPHVLPPLHAARLRRSTRKALYLRMAGRITGIAASVAVGFLIHAVLFRAAPPDRGPASAFVEAPVTGPADVSANEGAAFWSVRRLHDRAASLRPERTGRLIWQSPAAVPRVGDQT